MGDLSIKVTVANRVYPLTIDRSEEEEIRRAANRVNEQVKEFEQNYSVRDKQDLLAMCALQFANSNVNQGELTNSEENNILERLNSLEDHLKQYLDKAQ